jgi:hypothetical protein
LRQHENYAIATFYVDASTGQIIKRDLSGLDMKFTP